LSEFLHRLQERLKAKKQGLGSTSTKNQAGNRASLANGLKNLLDRLKHLSLPSSLQMSQIPAFVPKGMKPSGVATSFTYVLMIATATCFTYWILRIAQVPGAPGSSASNVKGMTLFSNQDGTSAYGLFGSKPLVTDNIFLRGVVITSKGADGRLDGFAIFEIDGTPTNAISVGENLGKGLTLQSIGDESATLLYEGQKLDFKLSKAGNKPSPSNKK
jgi:hypothetical protein